MQFLVIGGIATGIFYGLAAGAKDAGEAIDETGNGLLKITIAVAGGYAAAKYFKVI